MSDSDAPVSTRIASDALTIDIAARGAELQRIVDADSRDLLWDGDPAWWIGRAPILFPIVGALNGGEYRLDGQTYRLPRHGFARVSDFALRHHDATSATFRLTATEETREQYPFEFVLDIGYAVDGATLRIEAVIMNAGGAPMPASFGLHPALRWPLPYGAPRAEHLLRFTKPEPGPTCRLDAAGLIEPQTHPSPVEEHILRPTDAMFAHDAIIFPAVASRSIWYGAPGTPGVRLDFDMPQLGVWTKPGAPFLCIEPWQGLADPQGFDRDFRDKPGVVEVAPGGERRFSVELTFGVDA